MVGPRCGEGLPSTVVCVPRRRGADLIVTLLHYIPTRKALEIDSIDEASSFAGEHLRLAKPVATVRCFRGTELPRASDGSFVLPNTKGRLLLEVPNWFAT
jgi:hypothetical protein